jgi:predicted transcriptional regulator
LRNETNGATTLEDLVDLLEQQTPDSKNGPPQDGDQLAIQLHHVHLPKLAEYGVVDFEHGSGAVRYRPDEAVETVLDSLSGEVSLANP